jgi:hypothetical protein
MANYFVDSTTGDDADDGTTMDLAFATLKYAVANAGLVAGDYLWVRRVHSETVTSITNIAGSGSGVSPLTISGWPRAADSSITSATWTNGSTTVDLIVGLSMDREKHLGRYITAPDGVTYMITKITDSNTIIIDREYAGATVTTTAGACTIQADEDWVDDMGTEYGFDDSGWTIKESDWDADADDLPLIDYNAGNNYFYINQDHNTIWANMDHTNFSATGFVRLSTCVAHVRGCLSSHTNNTSSIYMENGTYFLERCVLVGAAAGGTSQRGAYLASAWIYGKNLAIYGHGDTGLHWVGSGGGYLENVNIGVEEALGDDDLYFGAHVTLYGRDVKLGAGSAEILFFDKHFGGRAEFENFNKILGAHKSLVPPGSLTKVDVVSGSGDPYKRPGGSDSVIEVLFNGTGIGIKNKYKAPPNNQLVFVHEFEVTTDTKNYRYYVQAEGIVAADELWIEAEYVSAKDDTSEYTYTKVESDEAFTARADAEDWAEYMEVTGIAPVATGKVRIKCYCRYYNATNKIYIDPKVVITDG